MNTAQLRNKAQDAADAREWAKAADLWDQAADAYPPHHPGNSLAAADIEMMRGFARSCRRKATH